MSLISKSLCNINLEAVIAIYTKDYHDYGQHRDIKTNRMHKYKQDWSKFVLR